MSELTHFDAAGAARMVDVGAKPATHRVAVAEAVLTAKPETVRRIRKGEFEKGDVLAIARLAGIMGAKRTADLIPLCHPLPLDSVRVEFEIPSETQIRVVAHAEVTAKTGVEMEALTAASVAALTVYDMVKAIDRDLEMGPIRLIEKRGGKSGDWTRR